MRKSILNFFALFLFATGMASAATIIAPAFQYFTHYTFALDTHTSPTGGLGFEPGFGPSVTRILMLEGDTTTWSFAADDNVDTELVDPFPFDKLPVQSLLVGLVDNLPDDPTETTTTHVVFFMSNAAAALAEGRSFDSTFPGPLKDGITHLTEDQLIAAIFSVTGPEGPEPGLDTLRDFAANPARNVNGTSTSAWFNLGDSFSIVTFSDGHVIGTGSSSFTQEQVVPEPGTVLLLGAGIGMLAVWKRRRAV